MAIKLTNYDEVIDRYLPNGKPIFRGALSPELHSYMVILSSMGYSSEEIEQTLRLYMTGGPT